MPGIVPAIPLDMEPTSGSRLMDHHPVEGGKTKRKYDWGFIEVLSRSSGHRIERISVKKNSELPIHFHEMRSEHWTVVEGEAEVQVGDDVVIMSPEDSLYIPAGVVHGLKPGAGKGVKLVAVHFGDSVSDADDLHCVVD